MKRVCVLLLLVLLGALPMLGSASPERDECDAGFIAFIGADAYQFSPLLDDELGEVRLFTILSYQDAAARRDYGLALWRLEIRGPEPSNAIVFTATGRTRIDDRGANLAEAYWDGRDDAGRLVPAGKYRYTFFARYLPDRIRDRASRYDYDWVVGIDGVDEARASTDEVIVNPTLDRDQSRAIRLSATSTACQLQQNAPIEPGFGFNYYYGSTHSHSNFSDGGQPTTSCSSGNAYGSGTYDPAAAYDFAHNTGGMDFWVINEHNHLINDSVATNNGPVTEAKVLQRYQDGRAAADAATVDDSFVGIYGMEWGVTSNSDQGHVTLLDTPVLFGWESCSNCNGPTPECTPGTDCYFDVYTPKRYGYLTMYQRSVENPSPAGALGIFCHPSSGQFDNFAFDTNADEAMEGIAVRSGLAFSSANDCSTTNVGATDYSTQWRTALSIGFHLGPVADHDSHCANYGVAIPTRTVYLIPNGTSPVLTKMHILQAHKARHFFATEDSNAQLVFETGDAAHIMGDIFDAGTSVTFRAAAYDPDGESLSSIEIWRGQIGAGALTAPYTSASNQSSLTITENIPSGTYYYFVHAVQADGHDLWSAPIWVTYGAASTCTDSDLPSASIVSPAGGSNVSGATTIQVAASDPTCGLASVEVSVDSGSWIPATLNGATGYYETTWNFAGNCNPTAQIDARATDSSTTSNVGSASPVPVNVVQNDFTAPTVTIAMPANGSTITCADTTIQVSATDASGIASVDVSIDGGAWTAATYNAASGYWELAWASSSASVGAHTIDARATDASCSANVGSAAQSAVTVSNDCSSAPVDVSGWTVTQANSTQTYTIPAGTTIPAGGTVVIGRNASQSAFESYWGVTLGANVVYLNSGNSMPLINGSETYTLADASSAVIDGPTIAMSSSAGQSIQRTSYCGAAGDTASWSVAADATGTPGTTAGSPCNAGVVISEFADASGTGNYVYEFIEIVNDAAVAAPDTQAPTTSITAPANGATVSGTVTVSATASDDTGVTNVELYVDGVLDSAIASAPWDWSWDTTGTTNGSHTLSTMAYDAAGNVGTSTAISVFVDNDLTPPTTSITSPADGTVVSGTVNVTADASDNVGVTSVEFLLDGAVQSTDATAPYAWSWNSSTATSGGHTLSSRAYDAAGNVGTSTAVNVTISAAGDLDVSGWTLTQANSAQTFTIPNGTVIPSGGYLVVGRSATQAAFESYWGVTLGPNAVYLDSGNSMPVINGDETYEIADDLGSNVDGPTIAMATSAGQSIQRLSPCSAAGDPASWSVGADSTATPGSGAGAPCGGGAVIDEFSDASGTGNYVYEFVEIHNDSSTPTPDTQAPTTSITAPSDGATISGTVTVSATATDDRGVTSVELYVDGALDSAIASSPYDWSWDTTATSNGSHTLMTKAYDAAGNVGTSAAVNVTVSNAVADTEPPTAPTNLSVSRSGRRKLSLVWTDSTDNVGVVEYQIWRSTSAGGPFSQVGTSMSASYLDGGLSKTTYYYYVTASDAAGNVSAPSATASGTPR